MCLRHVAAGRHVKSPHDGSNHSEGQASRVHQSSGRAGRGRVLFPCSHVEGVSEKLGDDTIFMHAKLIRRTDLEPKVPTGKVAETKTMAVAKSVILALLDLDEGVTSISSRRLRPMVESRVGFKITKQVWKDAVNLTANRGVPPYNKTEQPPTPHFHESRNDTPANTLADAGWRRTPQGFQRFTAGDYGLG